MKTITLTVVNPIGLHARPASMLAKLSNKFDCAITVYKNGDCDAIHEPKNIISIIAMGAMKGDRLTFSMDGVDEAEAITAIQEFIENGTGE
jgi:phosphocarrier protein